MVAQSLNSVADNYPVDNSVTAKGYPVAKVIWVSVLLFLATMAENVEPAMRKRKANFTAGECAVLFEKLEQNLETIKSQFSSTLSNKNKHKVWEEITEKVNSLGVFCRP